MTAQRSPGGPVGPDDPVSSQKRLGSLLNGLRAAVLGGSFAMLVTHLVGTVLGTSTTF